MQLTNFSFLNARNEFLSSIAKRKVASDRIETGKRLEQSTKDLGAISQASKQKLQMINDRASINNLKNLRSFLYSQEVSLHRVYEMYDKIEQLAIKAANPVTTSEERKDYQLEFEDYQKQLENLMASRYQERLLFSSTEKCGGSVDVDLLRDALSVLPCLRDLAKPLAPLRRTKVVTHLLQVVLCKIDILTKIRSKTKGRNPGPAQPASQRG